MSVADPAPTVAAPPPGLWALACAGERSAFAELAGRYWYPAYAWLRSAGLNPDDAARECAACLAHLCASEPPARDEPTAARFRDFLLHQTRSYHAQGLPPVSAASVVEIDGAKAARRFSQEPPKGADELFGRSWSLRVLELTIQSLEDDYRTSGKLPLYEALKPFLAFHAADAGYGDAAKSAGMSASAFHQQVFQFRQRYRAVLRAHIADTTRHADDVDSELTALMVGAT